MRRSIIWCGQRAGGSVLAHELRRGGKVVVLVGGDRLTVPGASRRGWSTV